MNVWIEILLNLETNIPVKLGQICGRRRWCRQGITIYDIDHDG